MIPENLVGLILFVLAVAPGWAWVRVAEKRRVLPDRSPLLEAAELVVIGVISTATAAALVIEIGEAFEWLPELRKLTARGSTFAQDQPYRTFAATVAVFVLSVAGAYWAARLFYRKHEPSLVPAGSVWRDVFGEGGKDRSVFVTAELLDGRTVEGYLSSYSTDSEGTDRDLALQPPIYVWSGGPLKRGRVTTDRTVLRGEQIVAIWVRYEWERSGKRQRFKKSRNPATRATP